LIRRNDGDRNGAGAELHEIVIRRIVFFDVARVEPVTFA